MFPVEFIRLFVCLSVLVIAPVDHSENLMRLGNDQGRK